MFETAVRKEGSYLAPARIMAMTVVDLLWGNAEVARKILHEFKPSMTKEAYLSFLDNNYKTEIYDGQTEKSQIQGNTTSR